MLTACSINRQLGRGYHYSETNSCDENAASKKVWVEKMYLENIGKIFTQHGAGAFKKELVRSSVFFFYLVVDHTV